ncbi:glycerate kinase [Synechocystis sp. PCC 7339]|uniref:glycerate kinase n=1 Tax=unclassified Synechocystis TaxID=2640012 RepID=UPI001BAFA640|nr:MULTISPECIES: glycerate kinase [unclassified Synechocystis]QUS61473.1 glycerate kinase [Synechocystis sp. PCC 7338]UAJ73650.1 glycerate kinase [Synechocystis sp. PCC 7339]
MRRILIAPDSFKGTLSAGEVCRITSEVLAPEFDCVAHPLADGGEGTLEAIAHNLDGQWQTVWVRGPLPGQKVDARYLWSAEREIAVIELAQASGLPLVPTGERNPEITTSYGTGELIAHAAQRGAKQIQLAIGGSATNDAGLGLLMALGWQFLDYQGQSVGWGGQALGKVSQVIPPVLDTFPEITLLCDVTSPFYGSNGAAFVYAPQKGADPAMVQRLNRGLEHFAQVVRKRNCFELNFPGAGAAGGIGGGVAWALKATIESGFTAIAQLTGLEQTMAQCDLVITGEGRFDNQSHRGKVVGRVIELAQAMGKPAIIMAGQSQENQTKIPPNLKQIFTLVGSDISATTALNNPQWALQRRLVEVKQYLDSMN